MASHIRTICGVFLSLLTSITHIGNIYIVKLAELSASSVSLTRGVFQILVFSILILIQRRRRTKDERIIGNDRDSEYSGDDSEAGKLTWFEKRKPMLLAVLYGFITASLSFAFVLGKPCLL